VGGWMNGRMDVQMDKPMMGRNVYSTALSLSLESNIKWTGKGKILFLKFKLITNVHNRRIRNGSP
jgi:hypothetical protein